MSTTTNPVTVTAEVAVNRASNKGVTVPLVLVIGSSRSPVPMRINTPNPPKRMYGDPKFLGGTRGAGASM